VLRFGAPCRLEIIRLNVSFNRSYPAAERQRVDDVFVRELARGQRNALLLPCDRRPENDGNGGAPSIVVRRSESRIICKSD
jgi:hypothetical protein